MANVTLRGKAQNTSGDLPSVGSLAPDFVLTGASLKDIGLAKFSGMKKLLYIVPSVDTPVCAKTTIELDEKMAKISDAKALLISADLPFALGRFCGEHKLKNVLPLSIFRSQEFAESYGVLLVDGPLAGLTARAVLVLDEQNNVVYSEWVKEISDAPDFEQALQLLI